MCQSQVSRRLVVSSSRRLAVSDLLCLLLACVVVIALSASSHSDDCDPPVYLSCGGGSCTWDIQSYVPCNLSQTPPSCKCGSQACTSATYTAAAQTTRWLVIGNGSRPEGCCQNIPWGRCVYEESRTCYITMWCVNLAGGSYCHTTSDCSYYPGAPYVVNGLWASENQCCIDSL